MKRRLSLILSFLCTLCSPFLSQTQEERLALRLIAVRSAVEAADLRAQIQRGASFGSLAKEHSIDPSSTQGGYLGLFRLADLNPDFQQGLQGLQPGQVSAVIPRGREHVLLQRLAPDEANWISSNEAGFQAFEKERYDDAAKNFQEAVQSAEKLTPIDERLADSLHGLAESYRMQKKYTEAEPVYRRYLAIRWGGPTAPDVVDRFSALLAVAYFRDARFTETVRGFEEALNRAPLAEDLYQAMSGMLFKALLISEADAVMSRAVTLFPTSKDVHYYQAELYHKNSNSKKALDAFERLSRMKPGPGIDLALDRLQQSVVFQKIARIRVELVQYEEAAAAYSKALEILPDSAESRLGLGDVYLQQGNPEEALSEYRRVTAANPQNVPAHFRVADANLQIGRLDAAAAAASKVLELNPRHQRAQYVLATALVRMGQQERAAKELEVYRQLEAATRAATDRGRNIVVVNRSAAAKLLEGRPEESVGLLLKAIQDDPDSPTHYLNLGMLQSKLGRHQEAIEIFKKMLDRGMDDFLVYWNLAREYELLGDVEASRRHRVVYLQNVDVALAETLASGLE
jgi:tetratricopeptide (TPR) repeat protein